MYRKVFAFVLSAVLMTLLCTGCAREAPAPGSGESSSPPPAGSSAPEGQGQHIQLTGEQEDYYRDYLLPLGDAGALMSDWEGGVPETDDRYGSVRDLEITDVVSRGKDLIMTVDLYGTVRLNPETGEEHIVPDNYYIPDTVIVRSPADDPHSPYILLGTSTVTLAGVHSEIAACRWQPIENPGRRALDALGEAVADQVAASERPDLSGYDQRLADYVYKVIASQRTIGGPEEITLWDLENLCTDLTVNWETVDYAPETIADPMEPFPLDAGLLRLMPNLRSFTTYYPLTDYSVFEKMEQLDDLYFSIDVVETPVDFSTLRVGHTKQLTITGFQQDIALDLSGCGVDTLNIHSWVSAVTELKGCDSVRELEFHNTRSDTRIINAETFPHLETLRMDFMSDYPRIRDFSRLSTFGEEVQIDLTLTYQACNDRTVESLAGVRLDSLTLDPKNGQWPLDGQPDPALVELVKAKQVTWASR